MKHKRVELDGARGEGGGQILRTALTMSLVTGRPFTITRLRARRDKPGLRPQHLAAVRVAAQLCDANVQHAEVGSTKLVFEPGATRAESVDHDVLTAGATGLILQTVQLPLAWSASDPVAVRLVGGTFNDHAPSYPFLAETWRRYLDLAGLSVEIAMPVAGFYPKGGGELRATINPGRPHGLSIAERGSLRGIRGIAFLCNLRHGAIGERMRDRAIERLAAQGLHADVDIEEVHGPGQGAALVLHADYETDRGPITATFTGLGKRGKRAESVADEAVNELFRHDAGEGAVDAHSADQILVPLSLADGPSRYEVAEPTDHLRTNIHTLKAFVDRTIRLDEDAGGGGVVTIGAG